MTKLVVDFCSYQAAKYAVEHWHYSKCMPVSKLVKFGVWEDERFIGAVIFSMGSTRNLGKKFELQMIEVCELARVALSTHNSYVSRILSITVRELKKRCPGLRLVISYSDRTEGHHGGIYQANNWIYIGLQPYDNSVRKYYKNGKIYHWRSVAAILNKSIYQQNVEGAKKLGYKVGEHIQKHKYIYPLDRAMRRQVSKLALPYPKRETQHAGD